MNKGEGGNGAAVVIVSILTQIEDPRVPLITEFDDANYIVHLVNLGIVSVAAECNDNSTRCFAAIASCLLKTPLGVGSDGL